jgi:PAS domain S-box-containing protein
VVAGLDVKDIIGRSIYDYIQPDSHDITRETVDRIFETGEPGYYEIKGVGPDGRISWYGTRMSSIKIDEEVVSIIQMSSDITERKQAETTVKESLAEKEILLKEVHHRVKNNMQVISSLLRLQAEKVKDKDFGDMLRDSQGRIQSMALVYNKLYQSQDLSHINMADYIGELTAGLIKSYATSSQRITPIIDPSSVFLGVDMAIPCGLVINELIVNSLKYAFPEGRVGEIAVSLKNGSDHELELEVSDNGVGVPEGFNMANTSTLGLKLVTNLVENQLDGKIELDRSQGTTFRITFPGPKEVK